jgi:hypothetical protein
VSPGPRRPSGRRGRSRRRGTRLLAWAVGIAATALAFVLGVAVGRALEDNPRPSPDRTYIRTLKPVPIAPARETVTVTRTG